VEHGIQLSGQITAIIFLVTAFLAFCYSSKSKKGVRFILYLSTSILFLQTILKTKSQFWQIGQFLELTLQWSAPLLLMLAFSIKKASKHLEWFIRWAIAATFIGHGLYAIGFHPVPGHFSGMMMSGLGMSNTVSLLSLKIIGVLDIFAALFILIPTSKWANTALFYIITWGFLTAIARIWSNLPFYSLSQVAEQWAFESTVRGVHFLIPIALYFLIKSQKKSSFAVNNDTETY